MREYLENMFSSDKEVEMLVPDWIDGVALHSRLRSLRPQLHHSVGV